jgi:hypothetical protein
MTTLKQAAVLAASAGWAIWLLSHSWSPREKAWLVRLFVALASATAVYALGVLCFRWPEPAWIPVQGFGPFPNRNQSGTFFGLTLALAVALATRALQKRRWGSFAAWTVLGGFDFFALLRADSRAGILIWGLVILLWFLFGGPVRRASLPIVGAAALVIAGVLLLARPAVLERATQTFAEGTGFRPLVYSDTARMIGASPAFGTGLGSFAAVFPQFQAASITTYAVTHPESDWLWFAAEAGIPAAILLLTLTIVWLKRAIAGTRGSGLERMAALAVFGFWLNSWMDVPGHRLGTLFAGILCVTIAARPPSAKGRPAWSKLGFPLLGVYSIGVGVFLALVSDPLPEVERLIERQDYHATVIAATRALRLTPLSWQLYLLRGEGLAYDGQWVAALEDFRCASLLQPINPEIAFFQGYVWSGLNPVLAENAWREALRRQPVKQRAELLGRMIDSLPEARRSVIRFNRLGGDDPRLLAVLQGYSLLDKNGKQELQAHLVDLDNELRPVVAGRLASEAAASRDFDQASRLIEVYFAPRVLPEPLNASEGDLRTRVDRDPSDFLAVFSLVRLLGSQQRWSDAAASMQRTVQLADCPRYLRFLCGQALAKSGRLEEAWQIFQPLLSHSVPGN